MLAISFLSSFAIGHSISITSANATCFGSCNGIANATVTGGVGPFVFAWSGPAGFTFSSGATTTVATGMCAGIYTLAVTDQSDMSVTTESVTITQPQQMGLILSPNNTSCYGSSTGAANAYVTGGTFPFSYLWSTGANTANVQGLSVGVYTVTVIDAYGCTVASNVSILQPQPVTVSVYSNGLACGNCNGSAQAYASGGTPPFTYLWNNMNGNPYTSMQTNLCPGNYTFTLSDANGCTTTGGTSIVSSPGLTLTVSQTPATCGNYDGSVCVSASGGTAPWAYLWSNSSTAPCLANVSAGMYTVTVYDNNNCQKDTTIQILNSNGVNIVLDSIVNINCSNNSAGTIAVHGMGGTGNYEYSWSNGDTTATITNLSPGNYTVVLFDVNGCTTSATYHIINSYNMYASIVVSPASCVNNGYAIINNVMGVNPPFSYLWSDPLHQITPTASNLVSGNYFVTITDNIGCTIIASANVYTVGSKVIKGRVYNDANQNCIQDAGELGLSGIILISTPGYIYGYTDSNGDYTIYTNQSNNTVAVASSNLYGYSPTCPSPSILNVNFTNSCDTLLNNNFGYYFNANFFDLSIFQNWTSANPGFTKTYNLYAHNNSPTSQNATIRLIYDPALIYTASTAGSVHNSTLHTIEWTQNLTPYYYSSYGQFTANFYVPTTVSISDTLCTLFEITPIAGDYNPLNNSKYFCQPVTGSYDPNSKDVIPRGYGSEGFITTSDSVLYYTVHFQNTGNDTALTVIVVDTLSQNVNPASIVPGASSHPYTFNLSEHGILTFRFDHILLPDSNVNESASNGFFNYTVNLKPNLSVGTVIENKASIFFDFNLPIVTNSTINTIATPLKISEILSNDKVEVYPNPFKDITTFEIKSENYKLPYKLEVFDMLGKKVRSIDNINSNTFNFSSDDLESGIYLYKVLSFDKEIGKGKIIVE